MLKLISELEWSSLPGGETGVSAGNIQEMPGLETERKVPLLCRGLHVGQHLGGVGAVHDLPPLPLGGEDDGGLYQPQELLAVSHHEIFVHSALQATPSQLESPQLGKLAYRTGLTAGHVISQLTEVS